MHISNGILILYTLVFGFSPSEPSAHQLLQPASVLPCYVTEAETKRVLINPAASIPRKSPDRSQEAAKSVQDAELPLAKTRQLESRVAKDSKPRIQPSWTVQRNRAGRTSENQSLDLFHALGGQAHQAAQRR